MQLSKDMRIYLSKMLDLKTFIAFTQSFNFMNSSLFFKPRLLKHGYTPAKDNEKEHLLLELKRLYRVLNRITKHQSSAKKLTLACFDDTLEQHRNLIRFFPTAATILLDACALLGSIQSFKFLIADLNSKSTYHHENLSAKHGHLEMLQLIYDVHQLQPRPQALLWALHRKQSHVVRYLVYEKKLPVYYNPSILIPVNGKRWNYKYKNHHYFFAGEFGDYNEALLEEMTDFPDNTLKESLLIDFKEAALKDQKRANLRKSYPNLDEQLEVIDAKRPRSVSW